MAFNDIGVRNRAHGGTCQGLVIELAPRASFSSPVHGGGGSGADGGGRM